MYYILKRIYICSIICIIYTNCIGQTYTGKIIRVIDGDTFIFQTETGSFKVRMLAIDAPEHDQPYGDESKQFLKQYEGKTARLESTGVDKYGRFLCFLYVAQECINLKSVKLGNAWHYKHFNSDKRFYEAEELARLKKSGLWALKNPIAPWDWRHNQ